jgi:drug/metabolite transporter (DMT)-like permease
LRKGLIFALISGTCYGFLSILGKLALGAGMEPIDLLSYRFCLASLIMLIYLAIRDRSLIRPTTRTLAKGAALGLGFYGVQSLLFFKALTYIPASTATLIIYFYPVAVTVMSMVFYKLRASPGIIISLVLLIAGCSLIFYDAFVKGISLYGITLAMISMIGFSVYLVTVQFFLRGEPPLRVTFYALVFTALFFSLLHSPLGLLTLSIQKISIICALALVPTVIAVSLLYRAIEQIGSAYTSIFSTLEPIVTVILAAAVLGEEIVAIQVIGMLLIIAGIIVPNMENLFFPRDAKGSTTVASKGID